MRSKVSNMNSLVLVLVAFSSLVSMFALTRIDSIVHGDLYNYGLHFSYKWAMPYWTMTTIVFITGWFNIIIASAFQFYVLLYGRKEAEATPQREPSRPEATQKPPIEERQLETAEAQTEEAVAPSIEVEMETRKEAEEAPEQAEEPVIVVEEEREAEMLSEPPQEETPTPTEDTFEEPQEPQEPINQQLPEETQPSAEETPSETVETEPQITDGEETQTSVPVEEHETPTEETQQQEAEVTEPY